MKVGTDGVLLGAWCRLEPGKDEVLLDIGTGTGLIALQLAQRSFDWSADIYAIEIDEPSARVAERNFAASKWANRLSISAVSLQKFVKNTHRKFDHIVSNPPFFIDSLTTPDPARTTARHATRLTYDELISLSVSILAPGGRISTIVPAGRETQKIVEIAAAENLRPIRIMEVHSTPKSGPKRTLIEFSTCATEPVQEGKLIIEENGTFSDAYRALTRDFYLKF